MAPREKMKTRQLAPLSPLWAGAVAAIASLYGLWPGMGLYRESGQSGEILVLLLFFGPISFLFVMIPAVLLLGAIFRRIEQRNRWIAALLLVALFLAVAGVPGLFGLLVLALGFYFAWSQARKEQVFTEEREQWCRRRQGCRRWGWFPGPLRGPLVEQDGPGRMQAAVGDRRRAGRRPLHGD
jgi:hypothetical protein